VYNISAYFTNGVPDPLLLGFPDPEEKKLRKRPIIQNFMPKSETEDLRK
jgi:hypothetical protein